MPRPFWFIFIGHLINTTGGSFLWPLNTIYLHDYLGKSLSLAGFVLMLNAAASVIGNLLGGYLFDKIGGFKAIITGAGITLAALIALTFSHGWPSYAILLVFIGLGSGVVNPSIYALAGAAWKDGGRKAFNAMYVAANIGVAIGSAMGGFIASISFDLIFISNMVLYLIFFIIAFMSYRNISDEAVSGISSIKIQGENVHHYRRNMRALLILSIGYALCWIAYVQWQTTIATYTQEIHISLEQYSLLWTVNGALIVLAQPLLAVFVKKFARSLKIQIIIGTFVFLVSFGVVAVSHHFSGFMSAMIILTCGEMLVWPAIPTIADQLAPKGKEGFYQGIINSAATAGRMVGPILGGILVDHFGMSILIIILFFLYVISMFTTIFYDKGLDKKFQTKVV